MPKFAANLTMMFTELVFLARFAAASQAGFEEARLEVALEHPFAVHVQDARIGEPAHQRLAHARGVRTGPGCEQQRLAHRLDGQRHDDLVGNLRCLPIAVAADQRDVLAHQLEGRPELHQKHLHLALQDARALGVSLPNTATCQELFNAAAAGGRAWDHSGMMRVLEGLACHEIGRPQLPAQAAG